MSITLPLRRILVVTSLACATGATLAAPAGAQLPGRLKKIGKDMLKNKVAGKDSAATDDKSTATPGAESSSGGKSDYLITSDRITLVLAALGPAVKRAELAASAATERATYDATKSKVTTCIQNGTGSNAMPSPANMEASTKLSEKLAQVQERVTAALAANDYRRYVYANDTLGVLATSVSATMFGLTTKCGTMPYAPRAMLELEILSREGSSDEASGDVVVDDATRSQLSRVQFGMIRERIALWSMMKSGTPVNSLGKEGVFSEEELAALDAQGARIMKLAPLFKGKTLTWSGTSDLRGW